MTDAQNEPMPKGAKIVAAVLAALVVIGIFWLVQKGDDLIDENDSAESKEPDDGEQDSGEPSLDADEIEATFIAINGGREISESCDAAYTHWSCFYDGVSVHNNSSIRIELTTDGGRTDAELDGLAEAAALHWFNFVGPEYDQIDYVIPRVNGVDHDELRRGDVALLN